MEQHFVTFYSPGTFVAETSTMPVPAWDVDLALSLMSGVVERYNARPYGFRFTTRARGDADLDSKEIARSHTYYVGGKIETLAEIEERGQPSEEILRSNMRGNGYDRVWTTTAGWKWTQPLLPDDVVLAKPE